MVIERWKGVTSFIITILHSFPLGKPRYALSFSRFIKIIYLG